MKKALSDAPIFKERQDGILEYCGSTEVPDVADAWQKLDAQIDVDVWSQASIAAAITPVWGGETIEEFALQVEKSRAYIYKISKTYKYYAVDKKSPRVENLTLKHHTLALRHPNPHAALLHAREKGMSTVRFEEWLIEEIGSGKTRGRSAMSEIKLSELRAFLERVEETIQEEFIDKCPDKEFATRVFGPWLRDAREENKLLYQSDIREIVRQAIDQRAARNIVEIIKATGISKHEVESAVIWLVDEQKAYEWVEQGGETEEARGSNAQFLQKSGARLGSDYSPPRASSRYVN